MMTQKEGWEKVTKDRFFLSLQSVTGRSVAPCTTAIVDPCNIATWTK